MKSKDVQKAADLLAGGAIAVIPTDTIYGIVGSALQKKTVERIYALRKRNPKKPVIVLIGSLGDVRAFGIKLDKKNEALLRRVWPGKVSIILPISGSGATGASRAFSYLHRGTRAIAFRMPKTPWLRKLLLATGPLVAPSANTEGDAPARNVREAKKYFGPARAGAVALYLDGGRLEAKPSTLIKIEKGAVKILRQGGVKI